MSAQIARLSDAILTKITDKMLWLSLIAGLSLVFAYAPFSQWWLPLLVLPLWFNLLFKQYQMSNDKPSKTITGHSFLFGLGWFAGGISWVHVSIAEFGGLPLIVSILLMLILCMYLAFFPALAGYLTAKGSAIFSSNNKLQLLLFPCFWLITEYLRGVVLTGFPWLSLGYSQIDGPLAALAPMIGEVGITFCLLLFSAAAAMLSHSKQRTVPITIMTTVLALTVYGQQQQWVTPTGQSVKTALVQGNIEQSIKWSPEQQWPTMLKYLDLTRVNYDAKLIIWPESAIPAIETMSTTQEFLEMADKSAALNNATIITGILNYNFESREYFNSLIVLGKKHQDEQSGSYFYNHSNRYYKNHLLPIGEFVPFGDLLRPLAPLFNLPMSSFSRGDYVQNNLVANDINVLPLICFEIAFADQLAANFSNTSNILLTVSNDAWFGNSHGPHQHMEIARMRALEFARPLVRATNNGVTAVTDHQGKITKQLPQFQQAVLVEDIILVDGVTPFSQYGSLPVWVTAFLILVAFILRKFF